MDDLSSFREQWKREIGGKATGSGSNSVERESLEDKEEDQEDDLHVKVT